MVHNCYLFLVSVFILGSPIMLVTYFSKFKVANDHLSRKELFFRFT